MDVGIIAVSAVVAMASVLWSFKWDSPYLDEHES
jgi:hypothetical protein